MKAVDTSTRPRLTINFQIPVGLLMYSRRFFLVLTIPSNSAFPKVAFVLFWWIIFVASVAVLQFRVHWVHGVRANLCWTTTLHFNDN